MSITKGEKIARLARPPGHENFYQGIVTATAGQDFKIETSPGGEEFLEITVPAGKVYTISVRVEYEITDED